MDKDDKTHQKLLKLDCPFTWEVSQHKTNLIDFNVDHDEKFVPELKFMRLIMATFDSTEDGDYVKAKERLKEVENIISELTRYKLEVARHIFESTKLHVLMRIDNNFNDEKMLMLDNIKILKEDIYESPLNEYKCCAWGFCNYSTISINRALSCAELAIDKDPESATAHFFLARNLRCARRKVSVFSKPEEKEIFHFSKAYQISRNPQFGIFLAQCFKEGRDTANAGKMYREINGMNIESASIQMRLALAFTQMKHLDLAEKCLKYVEAVTPEDSMFLHYKGIFLMKIFKYEEASKYLEQAVKSSSRSLNYAADITYVKCMRKLGKRFDFPAHFLNMIERYAESEKPKRKEMYLHVAFSYYWIKRNIREAIKYFLAAFEIEDESDILEYYHDPISDATVNVYRLLQENLLPKVEDYRKTQIISLSDETISASEKLKEFLEKYKARRIYLKNLHR